MKRTIAFLMAVLMAVSVLFTVNLSAVAYGDSMVSATAVTVGKEYVGAITETNSNDTFKVTISKPGTLKMKATSYIEYVNCYIYDENGSNLWGGLQIWNNTTKQVSMNSSLDLKAGTYYLVFEKYTGYIGRQYVNTGDYKFSFNYTASGESFDESKGDNNTLAVADSISLGKIYKGFIAVNDSTDTYKFNITSGKLRIQSTMKTEYMSCTLYDADGNVIWGETPHWNSAVMQSVNDDSLYVTGGTYYLSFSKYTGYTGYSYSNTGIYTFSVSLESANESFAETGYGKDNILETANTISLNKAYKGVIAVNDDQDVYKFTVKSKFDLAFIVNANDMNHLAFAVYNSDGAAVKTLRLDWDSTSKKISHKETITLEKGTYYLLITKYTGYTGYSYSNTGNYAIKINDGRPGKTSKITVASTATSVKLTWKAVSGATGYRVYQYNNGWKQLKTTTKTSYTVSGLNPAKSYKFAVKTYKNNNGTILWADGYTQVSAITLPGTPAPKATQTTSSVKLTWSKVSGATGYRVYQKVNGSWVAKKTTTGTSYTISGLKAGTQYQFAVKAYAKVGSKTVWGSYKTFTTATKPATPTIKATSSSKGVATLSWNNVAGETGYQVYYSTSKSSGYKKLSNIKANTVKVYAKNLKSGRTYYFRVRAYKSAGGSYVYGAFSNIGAVKVK